MSENKTLELVSTQLEELMQMDPATLEVALASGQLDSMFDNLYSKKLVAEQKAEFKNNNLTKEEVGEHLKGLREGIDDLRSMIVVSYDEDGPHNKVLLKILSPILQIMEEVYDTYDVEDCEILIELGSGDARLPAYAHKDDVGMDVYAAEDVEVAAGERALVSTGLKMAIPPGWQISVRPRSGLSLKSGIFVANAPGTIDPLYHDPVGIILYNSTNANYVVRKGDRIAQFVLEKIYHPTWRVVGNLAEFTNDSSRANASGEQGFGSTGV